MKERRKDALKLLAIATPMLAYGALTFEIGGAASTAEAITKSIVTTLGLAGTVAGLLMFFTKTSLGLVNPKEPKPIIKKEKEMSKIKDAITKEKPTTQEAKKGSSVDLMKREKELLNRRDELNRMLEEAETKLTDVRENLESKGWIQSADGWIID